MRLLRPRETHSYSASQVLELGFKLRSFLVSKRSLLSSLHLRMERAVSGSLGTSRLPNLPTVLSLATHSTFPGLSFPNESDLDRVLLRTLGRQNTAMSVETF